ncbi:hypothetical protein [Micromonospora sp. NPDC005707]|uniref:hypothetical protein n=1 Tax=Micromonospora sp. NPDC005707 TaxID=3157050 RepID=UPI0033E321CC
MQATSPTITTSLVAGSFTLAAAMVGFLSARHLQNRTSKANARDQLRIALNELIAAVFDLQIALAAYDTRWNSWRVRGQGVGMAFLEFIAGKAEGNWGHGTLRASQTVVDWDHKSADAAMAVISGPLSRVGAALGRVLLLPEPAVAVAGKDLSDALFAVVLAHGSPNIYRPAVRTRELKRAAERLEEALANLTAVAHKRLDPPPRWRRALEWSTGVVRRVR